MSWGFQSGHAIGLDERTYQYMHSKSTKNFFRVNDPVIDELTHQAAPDAGPAEQRAITKKIVDREFDQVLRMWMPYDNGFLVFQPHMRNSGRPRPAPHRRLRLARRSPGSGSTSSGEPDARDGAHVQVRRSGGSCWRSRSSCCRR